MIDSTIPPTPRQRPPFAHGCTVYVPAQRATESTLRSLIAFGRNIVAYREMIWQLFKRDFLMMHKRSFLGMGWLIIAPIMGILSWVIMNASGILQPGDVGVPYPAYVLISTSIWGLFMSFYSMTSDALQTASGFILQVGFPHEIMIVKQGLQAWAGFAISFAVTLLALCLFGVLPHWSVIAIPVLTVPLFLLGASIGMLVSIMKIVAPDLQRGVTFAMGLLMYITPVIYSSDVENTTLQAVFRWNPLTYLVGDARDLVLYGTVRSPSSYALSVGAVLLVSIVSWRLFHLTEERVIERMMN